MTTREESVDRAIAIFLEEDDWQRGLGIEDKRRRMRAALASRQEVSVEELASIYGQTLATDLLANYAITKRTTEG
jgi:hypothetical protein